MIGIVTFTAGMNFGSYLQAYALQVYLEKRGIENEIISYANRRHLINEYKWFFYTINPFVFYGNMAKIHKFRKERHGLKRTKFFANFRTTNFKKYKTIIFGSDAIWNFRHPSFGKDLFYFGAGLKAQRLVAYAVSFGSVDASCVIPEDVRKQLCRFSAISARDENSLEILKKCCDANIETTLDPTLLYDFSNEEKPCSCSDFILFYSDKKVERALQDAIRSYAAQIGKKIISLGYKHDFCDANIIPISPFEFLGYCRKASCIITTMYHGALFAIKYGKNFSLIMTDYRQNKMSLLYHLGLKDRILSESGDLDGIMNAPLDYRAVYSILETEKRKSENYLLNAISGTDRRDVVEKSVLCS